MTNANCWLVLLVSSFLYLHFGNNFSLQRFHTLFAAVYRKVVKGSDFWKNKMKLRMVKSWISLSFFHICLKILQTKFCKILFRQNCEINYARNSVLIRWFLRTSAPELSTLQLISAGGDVHSLFSTKWFWVFVSCSVVLSFFQGLFFCQRVFCN